MWHATASRLGLLPIQRILAEGSRRGASVEQFRALEVFGCTGERLTKHYAPLVRSVEVWEIDPSLEPALRRNLPTATVRITDSFAEIKRTLSRFDLVVVDNPVGCFGDGRCEHFDPFPDVARVLSDDSMLVLLVCSGEPGDCPAGTRCAGDRHRCLPAPLGGPAAASRPGNSQDR